MTVEQINTARAMSDLSKVLEIDGIELMGFQIYIPSGVPEPELCGCIVLRREDATSRTRLKDAGPMDYVHYVVRDREVVGLRSV